MIDHKKLRTLIDADPANTARTDQQVLDNWWWVNVTVKMDVPLAEFLLWLSNNGGRDRVDLAKSHADEDVRNAAHLMIDMMRAGLDLLLSRNDVRAAFAPLVGVGKPFSVAQKDSLLAISNVAMQRWKAEGFSQMDDKSWLYHFSVARAR